MPTQTYSNYRLVTGTNILWNRRSRGWQHSPRVGGRLVLTSLPYADSSAQMLYWSDPDHVGIPSGPIGDSGNSAGAMDSALAESYSRLRGKLYKGSAALGVTLGSYKQSRDMIVKASHTLTEDAISLYARAVGSRRPARDVADMVLEVIFGWQPLLQDIWSASNTVIQSAPVSGFVRGVSSKSYSWNDSASGPYYAYYNRGDGTVKVTRATEYTVSNPNLWLAERAGLCNPASVAWDLVPWSFVLNMFSNVGGLVNSITDFVGLSFPNGSVTVTRDYRASFYTAYPYPGQPTPSGRMGCSVHDKVRSVGSGVSTPPLVFRLPEVNWQLAAIAASLAVQKCSKLGRFLLYHRTK